MKKRDRQRKNHLQRRAHSSAPVAVATQPAEPRRSWERVGWVVAAVGVVAFGLTLAYRHWPTSTEEPARPSPKLPSQEIVADAKKPANARARKSEPDSFLDAFNAKDPKADKEAEESVLSNDELEKRFTALATVQDQLAAIDRQLKMPGALASEAQFNKAKADLERLRDDFNQKAPELEKALARQKRARPDDAVPRWLTGELLMLAGGEPEEILPHLEFARKQGLKRPRLLGTIAKQHLEANRFTVAYRAAETAMDAAGQDRYVWNRYSEIAFANNRFDEVREKLNHAFPGELPEWARGIRNNARDLQERWDIEQKIRAAEAKADDLPRVRLTIEHRRFARDAHGQPLTAIESTGKEEVMLELFENEAPKTVANFIELVSSGFYDGTRFHLAMPATMVGGGDPNSKSSDPADDGAGGPGYVIPDEYRLPGARSHFRGSIGMGKTRPHTAGSQFFFCLAPALAANGHFTVFGRVIAGQEAVDRITRGRTTPAVGPFGRLIPGDLLVHAEVVRKRNHVYRAVKE